MIDKLLQAVAEGRREPVYLLHGDLVLAEPAARRLAEALAAAAGCDVEVRHQPPRLGPLLDDLRTFSLFSPAKVLLAVNTAALSDRGAAADLVDDAEAALPAGGAELTPAARQGASRLLQALRLFHLDPAAGDPAAVIEGLPRWALEGGRALRKRRPRGRSKKEVETLTAGLVELLAAARGLDLVGWAEGDVAALGAAVADGFPANHSLVLAERSVAADHPVVEALAQRQAVVALGEVASERGGGWRGLEAVSRELAAETGVSIRRDALEELARRTLRHERQGPAEAESTARLAGEYRKLANLARGAAAGTGGGREAAAIDRRMVEEMVEDRGQEDVWQLLDAVGAGRSGEALERLGRLLAAAPDPVAARLAFFGLVASFCRQLTAIRGMMALGGVRPGETSFPRFRDRLAPALQAPLPGDLANPLAGLHPFRLHRAYLAAGRLSLEAAAALPWAVLETEKRLKGESGDPEAALAALLTHLATAGR
jgi:DNA polymerase III delta subunit